MGELPKANISTIGTAHTHDESMGRPEIFTYSWIVDFMVNVWANLPVPWMLRDMTFYKSILYMYDWLDKTKVSWLLSTHIMYFAMQHTAYSNPFVSVASFWPPNSIDSEFRFHGCQGVWVMCAFVLQNIDKSTKAFPQPHEGFVKKRIVWQRCQPLILGLPNFSKLESRT